ncbi:MAG TPA: type II toxin-antitoxin system VapC family toxin [Rhizomicrobium sp.]
MGRYLLDSSAFIRAQEGATSVRPQAREVMGDRSNAIYISLASLWELAIKAANGKLPFYSKMIADGSGALIASLQATNFLLLEIELDHLLGAAALPQHHRDPFDRLMIAQALQNDLTVITTDAVFARYAGLRLLSA